MLAKWFTKFSVVFTAGLLGGLINGLVLLLVTKYGLMSFVGVRAPATLAPDWMYSRLVWGGLWGLSFLALNPVSGHWATRAFFASLLPSAFQLFAILPQFAGHGLFVMGHGPWTAVIVILFNFIWAVAAAFWIRRVGV